MDERTVDISGFAAPGKFRVPALPSDYLFRPRLVEAFDVVRHVRLVCVQAPAGYGKTVLAAAWARRNTEPSSWASLDESDGSPSRFAKAIVGSLRASGHPELSNLLEDEGPWESGVDFVECLCERLEGVEGHGGLVLILDNCHVIGGCPHAVEMLDQLLLYAPAWLHFAIVSRGGCCASADHLRLSGRCVDVEMDPLRLTEREFAAYWGVHALDEDGRALHGYTGGWFAAAALLRSGLLDGGHPPAAADDPARGALDLVAPAAKGRLIAYAEKAIAALYDDETASFAAAASRVGEFSARMMQHVFGCSYEFALRQIALLVSGGVVRRRRMEGMESWFECVGVYVDVLAARTEPPRIAAWCRLASEWCEAEGLYDKAVEIAVGARDWEFVEGISWSRFTSLVKTSDFEIMWRWVSRIPRERVLSKPRDSLMCALGAARRRDFSLMNASVDVVLKTLKEGLDDRYCGIARVMCSCVRAISANRAEARRLARAGYDLLGSDDVFLRGMADQIIAESYMESDILRMDEELLRIYEKGEWRVDPYFGRSLLSTMTMLNGMLGRFSEQLDLDKVLGRYGAKDEPESPLFVRMRLGYAARCFHMGDAGAARSILDAHGDEVSVMGVEIDMAFFCTLSAMERFGRGDAPSASRLLARALDESPLFASFAHPSIALVSAASSADHSVLKALGRLSADEQPALLRLRAAAERAVFGEVRCVPSCRDYALGVSPDRPMERFQWLCLAALDEEGAGRAEAADELMRTALSIAEGQSYSRALVDDGPLLLPILRRVADRRSPFCAEVMKAIPSMVYASAACVDVLTPREREVALLLDTDLSYVEMADRLFVAEGTLRKHVKRIFAKLGVHSRAQAVAFLRSSANPEA